MLAERSHETGLRLFGQGHYKAALREFGRAIGEEESSRRWNDWAVTQTALHQPEEAEEGFRRALELDRRYAEAMVNLGALLMHLERNSEALTFLEGALRGLEENHKPSIRSLVGQCRSKLPVGFHPDAKDIAAILRQFVSSEPNEQSYFNMHVGRYVATLEMLPEGSPGQRLLELGAAFHHLTPALRGLKGYQEVRCSDVWEGNPQCQRRVVSADGREDFLFTVDNFDVERSPWPYTDGFFDVVLCCEMLEHLVSDPMCVLGEINRILNVRGLLLLTTPNIASAKSVTYVLRGESPYVYGQYEPGGRPTDRHNREYTVSEVQKLLEYAGFQVRKLRTRDSYWTSCREVMRHLAAQGFSVANRGDTVMALAVKKESVRERYPREFYNSAGTQTERRDLQATVVQGKDGINRATGEAQGGASRL
jgi:2-polyprenyl-3-methyl-5-hydroxy-6-metoxy-1,4-benzoquinol methylase